METLEMYYQARNYGCRVRKYIYNGLKTIHLENDLLSIGVLADKGADIYEFVYKPMDLDFLWHSSNGVRDPRNLVVSKAHTGGGFLDSYEGGWQELFPNINESCEYRGAPLVLIGMISSALAMFVISGNAQLIIIGTILVISVALDEGNGRGS